MCGLLIYIVRTYFPENVYIHNYNYVIYLISGLLRHTERYNQDILSYCKAYVEISPNNIHALRI